MNIDQLIEEEKNKTLRIDPKDLSKILDEIIKDKLLIKYLNDNDRPSCYIVSKHIAQIIRSCKNYSCVKIIAFCANKDLAIMDQSGTPIWANHQAVLIKEKTYYKGEEADLLWVIDPMLNPNNVFRLDEWKKRVYMKAKVLFKKNQLYFKSSGVSGSSVMIDELILGFLTFPAFFDHPRNYLFRNIFNEGNFFPLSNENAMSEEILNNKDYKNGNTLI